MTSYHMDAACFYINPYILWELLGVIPGRSVLLGAVSRVLLGILGWSGVCQCDKGWEVPKLPAAPLPWQLLGSDRAGAVKWERSGCWRTEVVKHGRLILSHSWIWTRNDTGEILPSLLGMKQCKTSFKILVAHVPSQTLCSMPLPFVEPGS